MISCEGIVMILQRSFVYLTNVGIVKIIQSLSRVLKSFLPNSDSNFDSNCGDDAEVML